ncbi:MAG: hypothetical protein ACI85F_002472 [Bacteroidia bacterium]|jgi:hypothetical protein
MKLSVNYQESYSRGELLLRSFLGFFYIMLPHAFLLALFGIWSGIISFISFWVILFTGRYPESFFEFNAGMKRWSLRVNARMWNLCDGYPSFGVNGTDEFTSLDIPYPESISRGLVLARMFFGLFYVIIPHGFILYFRIVWGGILMFIAWWMVLFTGKYPQEWHEFNVGTLRWSMRLGLYMSFMTDEYPRFSGKE